MLDSLIYIVYPIYRKNKGERKMFIIKVVAGKYKSYTGVFSAHHFEINDIDKLTIYLDPFEKGNVVEELLLSGDTVYIMDEAGHTIDKIEILDE
jgi:hypothetical protein